MPKILSFLAALSLVALGFAGDKETQPSSTPKDVPLELKIVNNTTEPYEHNTNGDSPFKFRQFILKSREEGRFPEAFSVEMQLEIKNTGSTPVQIWVDVDGTEMNLLLRGNEAELIEDKVDSKKKVGNPEVATIAPGKTHIIPLTTLEFGPAKQRKRWYITDTGLYTLSASFKTGASPAPKGSNPVKGTKFGEVELRSTPVTFRVVRPS